MSSARKVTFSLYISPRHESPNKNKMVGKLTARTEQISGAQPMESFLRAFQVVTR